MAMTIGNYTEIERRPRLARKVNDFLVIVEPIGEGLMGSWGFVIWREGFAEYARCHWNWTAEEACRRADEWLSKHPDGA